jgi:hypothetical protein
VSGFAATVPEFKPREGRDPGSAGAGTVGTMFRTVRRMPWFKAFAIVQLALLARRHLGLLTPEERRRAASLVRRARQLTPSERHELIALAQKLEPQSFAGAAFDRLSPVRRPRRFRRGR